MDPVTECPICGGELQATLSVYTSGVIIRRRPGAYRGIEVVDAGSRDDDGEVTSIYCENDHNEKQITEAVWGQEEIS